MKGKIRTWEKCPKCGKAFEHFSNLNLFICPTCQTRPQKFFIHIYHKVPGEKKGKALKIYRDQKGHLLDSYARAMELLSAINYNLTHHSLNPASFLKAEMEKFWCVNKLEAFLEEKEASAAPSYKKDVRRMVRVAQRYFGTKDVRDIDKEDIKNYKRALEKGDVIRDCLPEKFKRIWNKDKSPKTLKNYIEFFRTFLIWAGVPNLPELPEIEVLEPPIKWVSLDSQTQILNNIPADDTPIIQFLMLHPVRPGEARALRCKYVHLAEGVIEIVATFSRNVYRVKRKGKHSKSYALPIHSEMYDYLARMVMNNHPEAYVFVNPHTGGYFSQSALSGVWSRVRAKMGIPADLRLYDATRHSIASQLGNSGVSLLTISEMLGHASLETTKKYTHLDVHGLRVELEKRSLKTTVHELSMDNNRLH